MRRASVITAVLAVVGSGLAFAPSAGAVGPGTFTRITSPGSPFYLNAVTHSTVTISGVASKDLSLVDVYCYFANDTNRSAVLNSSPIAVNGSGHFHAVIAEAFETQGCRLRAIPDGETPSYVGSFTGPLLLSYEAVADTNSSLIIGGTDFVVQTAGSVVSVGPDQGGLVNLTPIDPLTRVPSPVVLNVIGDTGATDADGTASSLVVDGHFAYTPYLVLTRVQGDTGLTYTPPPATAHFSQSAKSGDDSMVLTFPLMRCSGANTVVPTSTSCPSVTKLGVSLVQTATTGANGRQVNVHISLVSTDGRHHAVNMQLLNVANEPATGQLGYLLPNHGTKFTAASPVPKTITHLPVGVQTTFVDRDIYAADGDANSSLGALTISSRPTSMRTYGDTVFVWNLKRTVSPHGSVGFSYVTSIGLKLAAVKSLARAAATSLTGHLKITSPKKHLATKHRHHVHVIVKAHASGNGLPTALTVNGKKGKLLHESATTATFRAVITLKPGAHTITASATDPGGNRETAKRKVVVG